MKIEKYRSTDSISVFRPMMFDLTLFPQTKCVLV